MSINHNDDCCMEISRWGIGILLKYEKNEYTKGKMHKNNSLTQLSN